MALRGYIDGVDRDNVHGWVQDEEHPDTPVSLIIQVDHGPVTRVLANSYREDLERNGVGDGRYSFSVPLKGISPLTPHVLRVARESDGADMPGSPVTLPAILSFDAKFMDDVSSLLADGADETELLARASFLAQQVDHLLQVCANKRANRPHYMAQRQFRVRWSGRDLPPEPTNLPRALVIDERFPERTRDAGSAAIISHMQSLQRLGFGVVFTPVDMAAESGEDPLEALGISCRSKPWSVTLEEVLAREANSFSLVYMHRFGNTRYLPLIRHYQPRARTIYSVADLHYLRLARQSTIEQRPELLEASNNVRMAELSAARFADAVITHSSFEAGLLKQQLPTANVHAVPWAVKPRPTQARFDQRRGVAFIGNYAHSPNIDAALWLVQEIMPALRKRAPEIECLLIGSNMPDVLKKIVGAGIRPIGHVEDLSSILEQVRLTVAPLTYGAGVKGKILDSMAAGVACACTPVAAEGLDLPEVLQATVGEGMEGLVDVMYRLHEDARFNATCRNAGLAYVATRLSDAQIDKLMREAVFGAKPLV